MVHTAVHIVFYWARWIDWSVKQLYLLLCKHWLLNGKSFLYPLSNVIELSNSFRQSIFFTKPNAIYLYWLRGLKRANKLCFSKYAVMVFFKYNFFRFNSLNVKRKIFYSSNTIRVGRQGNLFLLAPPWRLYFDDYKAVCKLWTICSHIVDFYPNLLYRV